MRPSDARLHAALIEAGLPELASRAAAAEFNDFFSRRATPKIALVDALKTHSGTGELITRVAAGEFDSGCDESEEWARSPEGQKALAELADAMPNADPRELGGAIAGPGGPFDHGQNVLDMSKALLVAYHDICKIDPENAEQRDAFAILFAGRINRSEDEAKVMVVGGLDFLAGLITQCHGVAQRAGLGGPLHKLCEERWREMPH